MAISIQNQLAKYRVGFLLVERDGTGGGVHGKHMTFAQSFHFARFRLGFLSVQKINEP